MERSEFLRLVKEQFPDIRGAINQQEGLLHFEVGVLQKRTQRAIYDDDPQALSACFQLAERAYKDGNKSLKAAIDQSFVEGLDFGTLEKPRTLAWDMMPEVLQSLFEKFHGYRGVSPYRR
jgi:hypothetical protein